MKSFNLAEYLIRQAMGSTPQAKRDPYDWWDYETLVSGGDAKWRQHVAIDRSLIDVLSDCTAFRNKKFRELRDMYGLTDDQLKNIWKTYIGYHPSYGAYILSVGPYVGDTFAEEARDKFAYFKIRKRQISEEDVAKSVGENIGSYMSMYGVTLEPGDLQLVVKGQPESLDPTGKKPRRKPVREIITSLDPNEPDIQDFLQRSPILGEGSEIGLNTRGLQKVIRQMWGNLYDQAIAEKAAENNVTVEAASFMVLQDLTFLRAVYDKVQQKYQQKVESGEAALSGMSQPPKFLDLTLHSKSGSVQFSSLPTNKLQARALAFRQEVLQIMDRGITDPQTIRDTLNADPSRKTKPVSFEAVVDKVNEITNLLSARRANIPDADEGSLRQVLMAETGMQSEEMGSSKGYSDLRSAFEMAKLYFSNLPVDPKSGSKDMAAFKLVPVMAFDLPENFHNVTTEELRQIRLDYEAGKGVQSPEAADAAEASENDLETQIGPKEEEKEEEEAVKQETKPTGTAPKSPTEEDDDDAYVPLSMKKNLVSTTLKNLIKIAEELDKEGKTDEAEEIHKVIRKYEEEI